MVFNTVTDALHWAARAFEAAGLYYGHGTDNAWDDAVALTLPVLDLPIDADHSVLQYRLSPGQSKQLQQLYRQRTEQRIPVPYLTQQAWFCGLSFYVDERVIIPRSPLAELITQQFSPWIASGGVHRILDLCTGSACIAIACAAAFPEAKVDAVELSVDAMAVAKINVKQHQVEHRVRILQSDVFSALTDERYDIIVSNPPYVNAQELVNLPAEFQHEPKLALAAGKDGLDIVRKILSQAIDHLTENGILVVEVGNSAAAVDTAFAHLPFTWLTFANGGEGVFLLNQNELAAHLC